jgi:ferrochelatase
VLLPLYPQYSKTTTGSSYNEWRRNFTSSPLRDVPVDYIKHYPGHPGYLDCFVAGINEAMTRFPDPRRVHLLFSAHGIPVSVVAAGDPYQEQITLTTRLIRERAAGICHGRFVTRARSAPGAGCSPPFMRWYPGWRRPA